ncbi:hypothetical protein M4D79_13330 [Mycolicibacterium novocastrense]|nr:hypothetical protein M4D79_13330 [Mycolicibacterium novocastrense]
MTRIRQAGELTEAMLAKPMSARRTRQATKGAARIFRQLTPAAVAHYFMMTIMFISPSGCTRT